MAPFSRVGPVGAMIRRRCSAAGGFFAGWLLLLDFAVLLLVGLAGVVSPALDSAYG